MKTSSKEKIKMGCDIHQFYTIKNNETGKTEFHEFVYVPFFKTDDEQTQFYKKMYDSTNTELALPEPFSGRFYDFFGIIGGVRSNYLNISSDDKQVGWPNDEIPETFDTSYLHSFCWYKLNDLTNYLDKTIDKIKRYQKSMVAKDPSYIFDGEDDEEFMIKTLEIYLNKLKTSTEYIKDNFKQYDVNSMKLLFAFDC